MACSSCGCSCRVTWQELVKMFPPPPGINSPEEARAAKEAALEADEDGSPILVWYEKIEAWADTFRLSLPAALYD